MSIGAHINIEILKIQVYKRDFQIKTVYSHRGDLISKCMKIFGTTSRRLTSGESAGLPQLHNKIYEYREGDLFTGKILIDTTKSMCADLKGIEGVAHFTVLDHETASNGCSSYNMVSVCVYVCVCVCVCVRLHRITSCLTTGCVTSSCDNRV